MNRLYPTHLADRRRPPPSHWYRRYGFGSRAGGYSLTHHADLTIGYAAQWINIVKREGFVIVGVVREGPGYGHILAKGPERRK